jgi:hypothetical protein
LKKTKKETIDYENRKIKTYGYKIVIMDFESSLINIEHSVGNLSYWQNLLNMLSIKYILLKLKIINSPYFTIVFGLLILKYNLKNAL